jgi:hypothetical protein
MHLFWEVGIASSSGTVLEDNFGLEIVAQVYEWEDCA